MKKILISGTNSYIGVSFENYIKAHYPDQFVVDTVDVSAADWQGKSFAGYDSVFHVAGIAHSDSGKISAEKEKLYYMVNTDLTVAVAQKAKSNGVKQFVFMSSIIVYGDSAPIGTVNRITSDTPACPTNCYGDSKLQAENGILLLQDDSFHVVIIRSPMIYGKGSKGNYPTLAKLAMSMPLFPYVRNERSMLYIDNLCEFVRLMVKNEEQGIFFPQNGEYSNTSEMVSLIATAHGKKLVLVKGFAWALKLMSYLTGLVDKAFGNLCYAMELSDYQEEYRVKNLTESIGETEND